MQHKEYSLDNICTNVRIYINHTWNKIKSNVSEYTHVSSQGYAAKRISLNICEKKKDYVENPALNPFQEDLPRTDFLSQWVEKVNLDIFDHLF
jgi:hypothetical protein